MSFPNRFPCVPQMTPSYNTGFLPYGVPVPQNLLQVPVMTPQPPVVQHPIMTPSPNFGVVMSQPIQYTAPKDIPFTTTTVFIGNIPECSPDTLIRQLAEKCGTVLTWKRNESSSGKLQAFVFCDYKHPESTLCALRLLDGYVVADKPLVVKVNSKSRNQLEQYMRHKMPGVPIPKVDSKPPMNAEMALVRAECDALLREYAGVLAGDPIAIKNMRKDAREARDVSTLDKGLPRDENEGGIKRSKNSSDLEDEEEQTRLDREAREKENSYLNCLRNWESRERKKRKEYDKDTERQEERSKLIMKETKHKHDFLCKYNDEKDDSKYYKANQWIHLTHAREREIEWDNRDRERELIVLDDMRRKVVDRGGKHVEERLLQIEKSMLSGDEVVEDIVSTCEEDNTVEEEPVQFIEVPQEIPDQQIGFTAIKFNVPTTAPVPTCFEVETNSVFAPSQLFEEDDDEEEPPQVVEEIVQPKLDMTEHFKYISAEEKKRLIQQIIDKIPTDPEALFSVEIDWSVVDQNLIDTRIRSWVNKKIIEYIGEEEPSLNDFICDKVLSKTSPAGLVKDIWTILDHEAEVFVVKLWRLLVFETQSKVVGVNNT